MSGRLVRGELRLDLECGNMLPLFGEATCRLRESAGCLRTPKSDQDQEQRAAQLLRIDASSTQLSQTETPHAVSQVVGRAESVINSV